MAGSQPQRDSEQGREGSFVPNSIRPGDVLADRYRLVDLLHESRGGRFWRAHDKVLERHVALHVIEAGDERAEGLLEAARRSATVPDRRLLRVLDADQVDGVVYVVNEWGSGRSLDVLLADDGPLNSRRAAWLVSEVAATIATAHDAGISHGRLVPENVLVDRTGSVRIIGFCVDAALHGLPPGRASTDVADLGGLLYCALTGRWPGISRSAVPAAPQEHGRVLRPRQVRAGIPRPLDLLCDQVVNPYVGHGSPHARDSHDLGTARGIADFLGEFVGDPTGMAEAEIASHRGGGNETIVLPVLPELPAQQGEEEPTPGPVSEPATEVLAHPSATTTGATEAAEPAPAPAPEADPGPHPQPDSEPDATDETDAGCEQTGEQTGEQQAAPSRPTAPPSSTELPTQAGLPIFDDDSDDVSWFTARAEKAPPPPPFEDPPVRPLFAPDPTDGQPVRKPRHPSSRTSGPGDFWPWDTSTGTGTGTGVTPVPEDDEDDDEGVPGRSWLRLGVGLMAALLLLVAIVVAFNLGRGRTPLGAVPEDEPRSRSSAPSSSAAARPITGLTARDFDPQGDPPEENRELAPLAVDGDPGTAWRTMTYDQDMGPGGLKTGVGLTIDLGATHAVSSVDLTFVGAPTSANIYVTGRPPTSVSGLKPAAEVSAESKERVSLDQPVPGRYVTVWLTSLPLIEGGYRGEIAEVAVRG